MLSSCKDVHRSVYIGISIVVLYVHHISDVSDDGFGSDVIGSTIYYQWEYILLL